MTPVIDVISSPLFLGVYFLFIILLILFIFSFQFSIFGFNFFFKKLSNKYGLLFLKTAEGNIKLPKLVDLTKTETKIKLGKVKSIYAYNREEFTEGRFFGLPFTIKDFDDTSKSYGLYCHIKDNNGNLVMETVEIDGKKYQTDNPKLTKFKGAYRVDPELIDGLIAKAGILSGMREFLKKNQITLIIVAVAAAICLMSLYVSYESYTMLQEQVLPTLRTLSQGTGTTILPGG